MFEVRAKKYLGQHFLNNLEIARQIAQTIPCEQETNVVEVGAGTGVLTQFLLQNEAIRLKAVEIDKESVAYLHNHFPTLEVIEGDFLRLDLPALFDQKPFCVIGNYPYNISSQIFFKILEHKDLIPICSGMIQKEVAQRISAKNGSKTYGILSVLLQAYYDIEYLFEVDKSMFVPPPKVQSAVIRLKRNSTQSIHCDEKLFKNIVKMAFNQRRKQMRNSLKSVVENASILKNAIFEKRPEQLSVEDFIYLTNLIKTA